MKKKLAGVVLAALLLRGAVLAGAGEAVSGWLRGNGERRSVSATLNIELDGAGEPKDETAPAPAETASPTKQAELSLLRIVPTAAPEQDGQEESSETSSAEIQTLNLGASVSRIHNRTALTPDFDNLAAQGLNLSLTAGQPQILIVHTHSSEAYTPDGSDRYTESDPYRTEDKAFSIIRVGDVLKEKLESYGLNVIHDREIYDYPSYTGSYTRSGAAVERYLQEYPSIRIVIDLHRDALGSGDVVYKTSAQVSGKTSAQVMMVVGTGENGLWHPYWQENLKLAMYLHNAMDASCPSLARHVELVSERYNQQLSTGMLILEVGSNGNTLREAMTAAELFGDAAGAALSKLVKTPD